MEEKKIPADTVTPASPGQAGAWASFLEKLLAGRKVRSVVLTEDFVISFVFDNKQSLSLSTHPQVPLIALLEENPPFLEESAVLKENLGGMSLSSVEAVANEPVLIFSFTGPLDRKVVWEGMKRSANVLLLDPEGKIIWALRNFKGEFRQGMSLEVWQPPPSRPVQGPASPEHAPEEDLHDINPRLLFSYLLEKAKARRKKAFVSKMKGLERKKEAISKEIAEAEKWLSLEPKAKTLLSAQNLRKRGESSVKVVDYSADPPREEVLEIDPTLTVLENAEKMFKQAKKGRERLKLFPERTAKIEAEIARLRFEVEKIDSAGDLLLLYPSPSEKKKLLEKKAVNSKLPKNVVSFDLPRGFKGFAGKNAGGNDHVSFRIAKGEDFWFHVADYKGSHVVVRNPYRLEELPLETELAAARYAGVHSSAPPDCAVEVTVTKAKFLSRVRKTPGAVYVSSFRKRLVDLKGNG